MSNYISREELKEEIEKCHITSGVTNQGVWNECVDSILRTIDYIPSADVRENIHGEWKQNFLGIEICSKCGEPIRDRRLNHRNFCNCCGADMRQAESEE